MSKYNVNQIIDVKVTSVCPYGAFVQIDDTYTGLIHISEINGKYISDINNYFKVGEIKKARVVMVDEDSKQIRLSMIGINIKKNNDKKLQDSTLGFELFEEILPEWIDEKLSEMEELSKKDAK